MDTEKQTVISRLRQQMKQAPLPAPAPQKPTHRVLADGYERQTAEEPLQMTNAYRRRVMRAVCKWIVLIGVGTLLAFAIIKVGIISI